MASTKRETVQPIPPIPGVEVPDRIIAPKAGWLVDPKNPVCPTPETTPRGGARQLSPPLWVHSP